MPFEFLSNLDTTTFFLLLIIFILFVLSMKKIMSIFMNVIWISIASVLFPVIMNRFFGFEIPIDRDSIISFIILGLSVYFVYLIGKSIYKVLGVAEKAAKKIPRPKEKKEKPEEKEHEEGDEKLKKKGRELEEKERELQKREQHLRWHAAMQDKKAGKRWEEDYAEIKEPAKQRSHVTPLPVIEQKKKRKQHRE